MSDTWPALPAHLQLSAANCEQRMKSYFNYLKQLHNVPLRN